MCFVEFLNSSHQLVILFLSRIIRDGLAHKNKRGHSHGIDMEGRKLYPREGILRVFCSCIVQKLLCTDRQRKRPMGLALSVQLQKKVQ